MTSLKPGHFARLQGIDFEAALTNDPDVVDLYWRGENAPISGFEQLVPGILWRHVDISSVDFVVHVSWVCDYRGEPFLVVDEQGESLVLDYNGDNFQKLAEMGFTMLDKFEFATVTVSRSDVQNLRRVERTVWPTGG